MAEAEAAAVLTPQEEEATVVAQPQNTATRMEILHQKATLIAIARWPQGLPPRMPIGIPQLERLMRHSIATIFRQTIGLILATTRRCS